jgi:hypothetical protein
VSPAPQSEPKALYVSRFVSFVRYCPEGYLSAICTANQPDGQAATLRIRNILVSVLDLDSTMSCTARRRAGLLSREGADMTLMCISLNDVK